MIIEHNYLLPSEDFNISLKLLRQTWAYPLGPLLVRKLGQEVSLFQRLPTHEICISEQRRNCCSLLLQVGRALAHCCLFLPFTSSQLSWARIVKDYLFSALFWQHSTIRARDTMPRLRSLTSVYCWKKL